VPDANRIVFFVSTENSHMRETRVPIIVIETNDLRLARVYMMMHDGYAKEHWTINSFIMHKAYVTSMHEQLVTALNRKHTQMPRIKSERIIATDTRRVKERIELEIQIERKTR